MSLEQFIGADDERMARRYEYDDETVIVANLGVADENASIEVLDDVVLVVVDTPAGTEQVEFEVPAGHDAKAFINNGVLTIEVRE